MFSLHHNEQQRVCTLRGTESLNNDLRFLTKTSEYGVRSFESKVESFDKIKTALGQFVAAFSRAAEKIAALNKESNTCFKKLSRRLLLLI